MSLDTDQKKAFAKLSKLKAAALFMKMGTGKTKVACDLIRDKLENIDIVIWIAPASLVRSDIYYSEIKKWSNGFFSKIHFFSIEGISKSESKYLQMRGFAENNRNFCVVDESIYIKNAQALRTKRLLSDYRLFDFRIILNGTPVTKSLIDLYSQITFLSPNILRMSEREFADRFLVYFDDGIDKRPWRRWSKPANIEALVEIIRPYIFNTELEEPCRIRIVDMAFSLDKIERRRYTRFKESFLRGKFFVNFLSVAQKFQKAYTITCKDKFCAVLTLVDEILGRDEKVVIFVKFVSEAKLLRKALGGLLYMGTKKDDLSSFETDEHILICTYGVGSVGLNLQCANNIIYFSQTFDYKDKEQAKCRVFRTGQKKVVNIYNMWIDTGLEDIIKFSLNRKENLLHNVERIISVEKARKL